MAWFTRSLLSTIINEHAPMKRKLVKQWSVPYMNARLRKAMYRRNMARNKFSLYGKQYWHENRRQRNLVVSLRKQSLTKYFSEKCSKKDKKFWQTISPFITNKNTKNRNNIILRENANTTVDSNEVCEIFIRPFEKTVVLCRGNVRPYEGPSVRPRFPDFSSTCFEISISNLVYTFNRWHDISSFSCSIIGLLWPSLQPKVGQTHFLQSWPHKSR